MYKLEGLRPLLSVPQHCDLKLTQSPSTSLLVQNIKDAILHKLEKLREREAEGLAPVRFVIIDMSPVYGGFAAPGSMRCCHAVFSPMT